MRGYQIRSAYCLFHFRKGFNKAFDLLMSNPRTGCQSVIVFVTDGKDTDGENIRCGPGVHLLLITLSHQSNFEFNNYKNDNFQLKNCDISFLFLLKT